MQNRKDKLLSMGSLPEPGAMKGRQFRRIRRDMIKAAGDGSDKLLAIVEIIEAERAIFQEDEQFVGKKLPRGGRHGGGVPGGGASAS